MAAAGAEAAEAAEAEIRFVCERAKGKLRVRIASPGYSRSANCQFPRALRVEGATFVAPPSAVTFVRTPGGTVFYRVKPSEIRREGVAAPAEIFGDDDTECVICMDAERATVFVPCGHYCACGDCAARLDVCPICRAGVTARVDRAEIN